MDKPLRPCLQPGCDQLVRGKLYCVRHQPERPYDHEWSELSKEIRRLEPICRICRRRRAKLVDHILPVRAGGARLDPRNLRPLCRFCHDRVTYHATRDTHDLNVRFPKRRKRFT